MFYPALLIFIATYILMLALSKYRAWIALVSAALYVVLGILPVSKVPGAIDWNVIMMIAGTMGTVSLFIDSGMPSLLADIITNKAPSIKWTVIFLSLFSALISAFMDNVATVLMIAPVALATAKKLDYSPVKMIVSIAIASNLEGAATLVGDTTSILLGGYAGMDFLDFFLWHGKIGIFFIVQVSAIAAILVLLVIFRKDNQSIYSFAYTEVKDYFPTALLSATVILLILASFIPGKPSVTNGLICVVIFFIGLIRNVIMSRSLRALTEPLMEIDYFTLLLLAGLFVVIAGISEAGVIDAIGRVFIKVSSDSFFLLYTLILWASVFFSAFIDNIPYVATMLPVVSSIAAAMGVPAMPLYLGLLSGATLGGNFTPIGASANITAVGILRREGFTVKNSEFMSIGVPFTLAAVIVGYILIWIIYV